MTMKTTINILFAFAIALPIATYAQDKPKKPEKSSALIDSEKEFPVAEDEIDRALVRACVEEAARVG